MHNIFKRNMKFSSTTVYSTKLLVLLRVKCTYYNVNQNACVFSALDLKLNLKCPVRNLNISNPLDVFWTYTWIRLLPQSVFFQTTYKENVENAH